MKVPEGGIFFNKNRICKAIYLDEIEKFIREKLSEENLRVLEGELGLKDRIFMLYWNNRFFTSLPKERVLEVVGNCISSYKFLLDSGLAPERIQHIFMKALMDVISLGSGTYFLSGDSGYNKHWFDQDGGGRGRIIGIKRHKYGRMFRFTLKKISEAIDKKYPLIPKSTRFSRDLVRGVGFKVMENKYPFSKQLLISFSYPLFLLYIRKKVSIAKFEEEFFAKHKGCLERLSSCNPTFLNKYREEVCKEISYDLGLDPDPSYSRGGYFQNNPTFPSRNSDYLYRIAQSIVCNFTDDELNLFEEVDSEKKVGNFSNQIKDRYYSKYPSLAPFREVEESIKRKISEYKFLLQKETAEVIREILFDEIESVAFVSRPTHLGNLEMMGNLKNGKVSSNKKITRAVDLLLSLLPENSIELLSMEYCGRNYSPREQLLARWKRAGFASNLKVFQNYLNSLRIRTGQYISRVDLQGLLEEVDIFFLYPNRGRFIKKIFRRLDTGRTTARILEKIRANESCDFYSNTVLLIRCLLLTPFLIALLCGIIISFPRN